MTSTYDGFIVATLFQSIIFIFFFFFFGSITFDHFIFIKRTDAFLYALSVAVDIAFSTASTFLIPAAMSDTGEIQTLITAPLAILVFIVVLRFKFERTQIFAVFLAVALAVIPLVFDTFKECFNNPYYFDDTTYWSLVFAPFSILLTIIMLVTNLVILDTVLTDYSDLQTNGRTAFFQLIVCLTIVLYRLKDAIIAL